MAHPAFILFILGAVAAERRIIQLSLPRRLPDVLTELRFMAVRHMRLLILESQYCAWSVNITAGYRRVLLFRLASL